MANSTIQKALERLLSDVAATAYGFVPPTPETHRRVNARPGNEQARDLRGVFGWSRPFEPTIVGERLFAALCDADAIEPHGQFFKSRVRIATLNGRHYLHSAYPTDAPDAVFFGPDTYRFVRAALTALPRRRFRRAVDIGCGSGAGGLAVAAACEVEALWLSDINPAALALARVNAAHAGRAARCVESDVLSALDGAFDLILANPPYLADPGKRAYRDGGAALGTELGVRIVSEGIARLAEDGVLFVYTGVPIAAGVDRFRLAVEQIVPPDRFEISYSEIDPDVFGEELETAPYDEVDRIAAVALAVKQRRV